MEAMNYNKLNPELRMLLFVTEKMCGVPQGDGVVFREHKKLKEIVDVKYIFSHIAIVYLEYSHSQVRRWMGMKYTSNVSHAISRVEWLMRYNVAYRNRLYNIAIECGIMPLAKHIIKIADNGKSR